MKKYKNGDRIHANSIKDNQILYVNAEPLINQPILVKTTHEDIIKAIVLFGTNLTKKQQKFTYFKLYNRLIEKDMKQIIYNNKTANKDDTTCDLNHDYDTQFGKICDDIFDLAIFNHLVFNKEIPITIK